MNKSNIEWTETTWNPTTGCTKISAGCKNCYASVMAKRLMAMGQHKYRNGFEVTEHPDELMRPYLWKKPTTVFVNSMSDLLHDDVSINFIRDVFKVMNDLPQHQFQVLTKRSENLRNYDERGLLSWSSNIWMGVSVEDGKVLHRIDDLRATRAHIKFLSIEPLIGPLPNLNLDGIDWVIVGGESGFKARPMKEEWVQDILEQCENAKVAFFFKQWGGKNKKLTGRTLNGRTYDAMPAQKRLIQYLNAT